MRYVNPKLINFLLFQVLWFACVLGAASNSWWPPSLAMAAMLIWQFWPSSASSGRRPEASLRRVDARLLLVAALIGLILDSAWMQAGWLRFAMNPLTVDIAPLWIIYLWLGLALTLNHSLSWMQGRLGLAAILAFVASPLSYLAGASLGALEIQAERGVALAVIGAAWAVCFPLLLVLARTWSSRAEPSHQLLLPKEY